MPKFKKKINEIEAIMYNGANKNQIDNLTGLVSKRLLEIRPGLWIEEGNWVVVDSETGDISSLSNKEMQNKYENV